MAENFPDLEKEIHIQIQEFQRGQVRQSQRDSHQDTLISNCQKLKGREF